MKTYPPQQAALELDTTGDEGVEGREKETIVSHHHSQSMTVISFKCEKRQMLFLFP